MAAYGGDAGHTIDVAGNDVAFQPVAHAQGPFQVHRFAVAQIAKGRAGQSFGHHVELRHAAPAVGQRQARPGDGDAVSPDQALSQRTDVDGQPLAGALAGRSAHRADVLDDSAEHSIVNARLSP